MHRQQSKLKVRGGLLFRGLAAISLLAALFLSACAEEVLISGVAESGITEVSATITWDTNVTATSQVEYGTTTSYGSETTLSTTLVEAHSVALTGLSAGTTFYYLAKSGDAVSAQGTFSTTIVAVTPVIYDVAVSGITDVAATVAWTTSSNGDSQVEYGTTTSYGTVTTLSTALVSAHSVDLAGLTADTTYYYRVKSSGAVSDQGTLSTVKDIAAITLLWESSGHNNMEFLLANGWDTYCAQCMSPLNWDPDAKMGGPAGGCFTHKGPGPRPGHNSKTLGNDGIPVEDLSPISCIICHEEGIGPDIALWNNATEGYDAVVSADDLCQKCHTASWGGYMAVASPSDKDGDSGTADGGTATSLTDATQDFTTTVAVGMTAFNETDNSLATVTAVVSDTEITTTALIARPLNRVSDGAIGLAEPDLLWEADDKYWIYQGPLIEGDIVSGTSHQITVAGSAHPNEIGMTAAEKVGSSCVDCHSTHSRAADCTDCHTGLTAVNGHIASMAKVTCVACHSGDLTDVGWNSDETEFTSGSWSTSTRPPYATTFSAQNTHNISRVGKTCADCHYTDNPWGLAVRE